MPQKPKPEYIDSENPEATDAWFAKARPAQEVLPELFGKAAAQELLKPKTQTQAALDPAGQTCGKSSGLRIDSTDKSTSN
jgi:hypothetical protein